MLTCIGCAAGTALGASDATRFVDRQHARSPTAALGVSGAPPRTQLINWVRGTDNAGDEPGPTTTPVTTVRPSVHGDVLHSRPAVVNYGGSTGVVVFYGANDGMLHAINGNPTGTGAGDELWSFVPEEMFGKLNRLRINTPEVRLPSTPAASPATPRDYFVDGPIGVYQRFDAERQRRPGDHLRRHAPRRPPALCLRRDQPERAAPALEEDAARDLPLLGQTWSEPKVARIKGNINPVLVFGAGYDAAAEDASAPGTTTMGNAIYVLDAVTGSLLQDLRRRRAAFPPTSR